ncbi:MAG: dual specificity protein phosphatase family protein, partial [Pseudomonadota bacterium]|nr:dual specificity protein phosphatase family protein [Pseudomonadota bacterium]
DMRVLGLGAAIQALGMKWLHLPITDVSTPTAEWEARWTDERPFVHAVLDRGGKVLVHCKGGLGRAGTVAARVLIERGMAPGAAIAAVRRVRPGAIETSAQESYLKRLAGRPKKAQDAEGAAHAH